MIEKKCEKNLEKAERVSVRKRYTMKTPNTSYLPKLGLICGNFFLVIRPSWPKYYFK
jgi:hypothetical protein